MRFEQRPHIFSKHERSKDIDFLAIDIDGPDYLIFEHLDINPRVVCIEINAGHSPESVAIIDDKKAAEIIGQPFSRFMKIAKKKGFALVCYTGNAFFVKKNELGELVELSPIEAYSDFINHLTQKEKFWLYLCIRRSDFDPPPFQIGPNY